MKPSDVGVTGQLPDGAQGSLLKGFLCSLTGAVDVIDLGAVREGVNGNAQTKICVAF